MRAAGAGAPQLECRSHSTDDVCRMRGALMGRIAALPCLEGADVPYAMMCAVSSGSLHMWQLDEA